jgi:NarL family two-component system sensor histidine kinase LiaS
MSDERVALAQELHDGIAQDLVALGFSIDTLVSQSQDLEIKSSLRQLRFTITELIEKVRAEIHSLRTSSESLVSITDTDTTFELQRIFLELIRNVQEHSEASTLSIQVSDNGIGGARPHQGSFGLAGVQERATKLNGETHIVSNTEGTTITVTIPLDR